MNVIMGTLASDIFRYLNSVIAGLKYIHISDMVGTTMHMHGQ